MLLTVILLIFAANYGTATVFGDSNCAVRAQCSSPFTDIGGSCLYVYTGQSGTWYEISNLCLQVGGRLAVLDDANALYYLINTIKGQGDHNYWIGASDTDVEGSFRWVDGTEVKMGAPYWAGYCHKGDLHQEPNGGSDENCVDLYYQEYFLFNDAPCDENYYGICQQVN